MKIADKGKAAVMAAATAEVRHAKAVLETGALQSAIFNSANFSSIATDANGVIQIFNVGAERMLGFTADEVVNAITPAQISDPQELVARATALSVELGVTITPGFEALVFKASRGIEDIYELTYIRKDGSRFPAVVSVTALRDAAGAIIGYLLIGTDNTARKRAEEALLEAGALQRAIFNSANFSSIATDTSGVIRIFNVGAERMLGYRAAEVVGKLSATDLHVPEELDARSAALSLELGTHVAAGFDTLVSKASRGIEDIYELTKVRKDGSRFPAAVSVTALRDAQDAIIGYLLIGTDNTARKQTELLEETVRQKVVAENASRMKSEFLANMSHELRTPLNAIIGFSEVLRDGLLGDLTEKQRGFTSDIFDSGNHLLALINDILDLSKVEAGKMTLDLEPVRITSLFVNSLAIVREKAATRDVHVHIDAPEDLGSINADARKVKQIIYNLLSNAVKFAVDGGEVTLCARRVPRADVGRISGARAGRTFPLAMSRYGEFLEIRVTDRGIGISAAGVRELFEPFSQIDSGLARKYDGSGLGLAMVRALAELHGGSVAVESTEGEGSCFTVWLPLRVSQELTPPPVLRADVPRLPGPAVARLPRTSHTALMVEEDARAADIIRAQLEGLGFTVLHAPSAEVALQLAVQQPLALITLDVFLPDMDGWQLLDRLKQLAGLKHVPVVIISMAADSGRGFALGAAAVVQKPISRNDLHDLLAGLGFLPTPQGKTLKVLIVDDDPTAVELVAVRMLALATTVLKAYGGREAIAMARAELPDLIILDLVMPDVSGFDVVDALDADVVTARIPILVVTGAEMRSDERAKLQGHVVAIMEKGQFGHDRFSSEVKRAMAGREVRA